MTIIALDLSMSNTGVAVFDDTGNCIELISIETSRDAGHPRRLKEIVKKMQKIKKQYRPKIVVIEQGFQRFIKSSEALHKVLGVTEFVFYDTEIITYHATAVRKEILGNGHLKKADVQKYILENYKHMNFKNYDESDSYALGLTYLKKKGIIK